MSHGTKSAAAATKAALLTAGFVTGQGMYYVNNKYKRHDGIESQKDPTTAFLLSKDCENIQMGPSDQYLEFKYAANIDDMESSSSSSLSSSLGRASLAPTDIVTRAGGRSPGIYIPNTSTIGTTSLTVAAAAAAAAAATTDTNGEDGGDTAPYAESANGENRVSIAFAVLTTTSTTATATEKTRRRMKTSANRELDLLAMAKAEEKRTKDRRLMRKINHEAMSVIPDEDDDDVCGEGEEDMYMDRTTMNLPLYQGIQAEIRIPSSNPFPRSSSLLLSNDNELDDVRRSNHNGRNSLPSSNSSSAALGDVVLAAAIERNTREERRFDGDHQQQQRGHERDFDHERYRRDRHTLLIEHHHRQQEEKVEGDTDRLDEKLQSTHRSRWRQPAGEYPTATAFRPGEVLEIASDDNENEELYFATDGGKETENTALKDGFVLCKQQQQLLHRHQKQKQKQKRETKEMRVDQCPNPQEFQQKQLRNGQIMTTDFFVDEVEKEDSQEEEKEVVIEVVIEGEKEVEQGRAGGDVDGKVEIGEKEEDEWSALAKRFPCALCGDVLAAPLLTNCGCHVCGECYHLHTATSSSSSSSSSSFSSSSSSSSSSSFSFSSFSSLVNGKNKHAMGVFTATATDDDDDDDVEGVCEGDQCGRAVGRPVRAAGFMGGGEERNGGKKTKANKAERNERKERGERGEGTETPSAGKVVEEIGVSVRADLEEHVEWVVERNGDDADEELGGARGEEGLHQDGLISEDSDYYADADNKPTAAPLQEQQLTPPLSPAPAPLHLCGKEVIFVIFDQLLDREIVRHVERHFKQQRQQRQQQQQQGQRERQTQREVERARESKGMGAGEAWRARRSAYLQREGLNDPLSSLSS